MTDPNSDVRSILDLNGRTSKPRTNGLTWLIDTGAGIRQLDDLLDVCSPHVDMVKLAFGTSLITANLEEKISTIRRHDVDVCLGGTLFELMYLRDRVDDYRRFVRDLGIGTVEISDGSITIPGDDKVRIIESFAPDFKVVSEVGSKDSSVVVAPARWVKAIQRELAAGASHVILEGRESGTSGMYRTTGEMRTGLIEEVLDAGIEPERLVFEAPQKAHQLYLIKLLGPDVNLANIAVDNVIACESLRRGLRGDTLEHFHDTANRPS